MPRGMKKKNCPNCVFVTEGYKCPQCGVISAPNYSLRYASVEERLYGTSYGSGRYNEGLGERTYGKQDFNRKVESKGLRLVEPGEKTVTSKEEKRKKLVQKQKPAIDKAIGNALKYL